MNGPGKRERRGFDTPNREPVVIAVDGKSARGARTDGDRAATLLGAFDAGDRKKASRCSVIAAPPA